MASKIQLMPFWKRDHDAKLTPSLLFCNLHTLRWRSQLLLSRLNALSAHWRNVRALEERLAMTLRKKEGSTWSLRSALWGGLTVLTCPCCIPIWIWLLSGTAIGALLTRNILATVAIFLVPFLFFLWKAIRSYESNKETVA